MYYASKLVKCKSYVIKEKIVKSMIADLWKMDLRKFVNCYHCVVPYLGS